MSQTEEIWTNYFFPPKKYFGITNYVEKNEKFIIFSYSDDRNYDSHIHINSELLIYKKSIYLQFHQHLTHVLPLSLVFSTSMSSMCHHMARVFSTPSFFLVICQIVDKLFRFLAYSSKVPFHGYFTFLLIFLHWNYYKQIIK